LLFFPERHLRLIEEWKREDIVLYERTRAFEAAWNMVNSNTYITLIGDPASGKSATARHIALKLESDNFEVRNTRM
jgi:tRNA A37 threonylcarbamoyladenosine biosynthesis protein TsaE